MTNDVGGMLYVFSGSLDVPLSHALNNKAEIVKMVNEINFFIQNFVKVYAFMLFFVENEIF